MPHLEAGQLAPQNLPFPADGTASENERSRRPLARTGQLHEEHAHHDTERRGHSRILSHLLAGSGRLHNSSTRVRQTSDMEDAMGHRFRWAAVLAGVLLAVIVGLVSVNAGGVQGSAGMPP